jgi:hypothetical protein
MGGKTRLVMRADLRTELKDSGALWSDPELNRVIEKAVADLSRFLPKQRAYEESLQFTVTAEAFTAPKDTDADYIVDNQTLNGVSAGGIFTLTGTQPDVPRVLTLLITDANTSITNFTIIIKGIDEEDDAIEEAFHFADGLSQTGKKLFKRVNEVELDQIAGTTAAADVLDIGIGAYTDCWVQLANKPIKWGSETSVTDSASNALTRNTDFYIDYINGRVKPISGGKIAAAEACTITYIKSQLAIDISSLPDLIRVDRTEYPVGDIPQTFVEADIYGKLLFIASLGPTEDQGSMREDKHIRVYYDAEHSPPTDYAPGSIPEFLENTVILAASAYALFQYALKMEHQAVTDLASARTEFGLTTAIHTLADAALDKIATHTTEAGTALTSAKKYLDNNTNEDAAGWLTKITTDIADLRTAVKTAIDAANTYLDEVDTTDLGAATPDSAEEVLKKYEDKVNTVNLGKEVAELGVKYSEAWQGIATARTNAAIGYIQEATTRLNNLQSYIQQAGGWKAVAEGFLAEAARRVNMSESFIAEASQRIFEMDRYLTEAAGYLEAAELDVATADRFRAEAIERRNEAWAIWRDRKQYIGDYAQASLRQPPQYD